MHSLNRILVNIKELLGDTTDMNRSEIINRVRDYAEQETECFYEDAYDWRETDTAGRWQSEYPENVLLGSEDPERLLEEIADCEAAQREERDNNLSMLGGYAFMPLNDLIPLLWTQSDTKSEKDEGFAVEMASYYIKNLAKLLSGEYFYNSLFYNTDEYTARISRDTHKKIQESPKDWAIVVFDQHF